MMKGLFILALVFCVTCFISGCNDGSTDPAGSPPNIIISRYEIAHDNNGDSLANPGEDVYLKLWAKNTGEAPAHILIIKEAKSLSGYIHAFWDGIGSSEINNFAEIGGGREALVSDKGRLHLTISPKTEVDSTYKIVVNFFDEDRREWFDTLGIKIVKHGANIVLSRYVVNSEDNGNGKANPGETLNISLALKNIGSSRAKKVSLIDCKSSTKNITIKYFNRYDFQYGDLEPGQELFAWNNEELVLGISNLIKADSAYDIYLKIADEDENVWYDTLSVYVEKIKADIKVSKLTMLYESKEDGRINPSEVVDYLVYLKNIGVEKTNKVEIVDVTYPIKYCGITKYYSMSAGDMPPGDEKPCNGSGANHASIRLEVYKYAPIGAKIPVTFRIRDKDYNEWKDTVEFTVE